MVPNMCQKQRKNRQSPKTSKQTTSDTSGLHLHESIWRQTSTTSTDSNRCRIRHGNGSSCTRQEPTTTIPDTMSTNIHVRMWTSISNTIYHSTTIRPRRIHTEPTEGPAYSSQSQGSIERFHRTLMGQVRALAVVQQVTASRKLQPYIERTTSDHAVDCTACSLATEQVCHAQ